MTQFARIYENNSRTITSSMSMEDVKNLLLQQYPKKGKFGAFKYRDAYVVLQNSSKFRVGVDAGWPKWPRLNASGEYNSSAGSHNLPDDAEGTPPPVSRRRRPVGQKTVMRMSRGSTRGSHERQLLGPSPVLLSLTSRVSNSNRA